MEHDCVMRDKSAPLPHSKIVAAASALQQRVDNDDDSSRKFSLSPAGPAANTTEAAGNAAAAATTKIGNNLSSEQLQHSSSSSSSSSSLTGDPKKSLSFPNRVRKEKDATVLSNDTRLPRAFKRERRRIFALRDGEYLGHGGASSCRVSSVRAERNRRERLRRRIDAVHGSSSLLIAQARREELERRIAALRQDSLGLPVAPYNTTQFLMEEHQDEVDEEELVHPRGKGGDSFSSCYWFGEVCNSSSFEDDEYLHAQFCAEYDSVASERLHAMSKAELVHEYLLLEARIDSLEEELKVVKKAKETDEPMEIQATEEDIAKIVVFQQEISKLLRKNRRLQIENDIRQQDVVVAPGAAAAAAAAAAEESISVDDQ